MRGKEFLIRATTAVTLAVPMVPIAYAAIDTAQTHTRTAQIITSVNNDLAQTNFDLSAPGLRPSAKKILLERKADADYFKEGVRERANTHYLNDASLAFSGAGLSFGLGIAWARFYRRRRSSAKQV